MYLKNLLKISCLVFICFFTNTVIAQNKTITGNVNDSNDGSPIIGALVTTVPASSVETRTDVNGNFQIAVPAATVELSFSYLGYKKVTLSIKSTTVLKVKLETFSACNLSSVVEVGFGRQLASNVTGSVAYLGTDDFNKGIIATPDQLFQGRVAGVQVTPSSGEPGASSVIDIRGASSIGAGSSPLYVIDGVPIENGGTLGSALNGALGTSTPRNPLEFLNPADIENISILKDAASAAIYGIRGANGVILITTKKGVKGQGIQFSASTSISTPAKKYDLLNASQFLSTIKALGVNPSEINQGANTDWQDQIFRTAVSQNYTLGFGGAKDGFVYRASGSYDNQNGIIKTSGLQRLTGRFNASQTLFGNRLKLDLTFLASNVKNAYAPTTDNAGYQGNLIGATIIANPTYPIYNPDGSYYFDGYNRNPVAMLNLIDDQDNVNRYLTNFSATVKIAKNLSYKGTISNDNSSAKRSTWYDPKLQGYNANDYARGLYIYDISGNGRGVIQNIQLSSINTEHSLNYDVKFNDNSAFSVLAGYAYQRTNNDQWNRIGYGTQTPNVLVKDINSFTRQTPVYGDSTQTKLQSFFGRVNYLYDDKYLLTANVRNDNSSIFSSNNSNALFYGLAGKWKIMNEDFIPKGLFDDLSLRLNYGKTGNQQVPPGVVYSNLKWETATQYGGGLDFAILKGKVSGTIDYFNKSVADLIVNREVPPPSISPYALVNLPAQVVNKGVELSLNFEVVNNYQFRWNIAYNMTFINNQVENFGSRNINTGSIQGQGISGAYAQVIANNQPLYTFNLPVFTGYDGNGFGTYGGDGITDSKLLGSALPTFTAGLANNFRYGNFSLSIFFNRSAGFYVYNNTANAYFYKGNLASGHNVTNPVAASNENVLNSGSQSTRFLEKGDFTRLSNASIGYNFILHNSKTIKSVKLGISGQNLLLFTNYSGLDPEVNTNETVNYVPSRGIDYTGYPKARSFTFNINAGF
jgi:iron complex outermembrane receptor protein